MRYLVRLLPRSTSNEVFLSSIRSIAKATGSEARNPKWTSYGALEIDIFVSSKPDFDMFLVAAEPLGKLEFKHDLNIAPPHQSEEEVFAEARSMFNAERYWECHEVLEGAWRNMEGEEKRYVQGIILVCAALVHHQKGEETVAMGVLRRALKQLAFGVPSYHGIDTNNLRLSVEQMVSNGRLDTLRI